MKQSKKQRMSVGALAVRARVRPPSEDANGFRPHPTFEVILKARELMVKMGIYASRLR